MDRSRVALAALVSVALIAAGCGSDDEEPNSEAKRDSSARAEKTRTAGKAEKAEPKRGSVRGQMVECIESGVGYDVSAGDDDPHRLSVKSSDGKLQAVVVVHSDVAAARKAVAKTVEQDDLDAVTFGRAELILRAAKGNEAGVMANCVAAGYNR